MKTLYFEFNFLKRFFCQVFVFFFGSSMSHDFFSKDVMKWVFRPCLCTRSWQIRREKRHDVGNNILQTQYKPSGV
jgi:hypothetical protein